RRGRRMALDIVGEIGNQLFADRLVDCRHGRRPPFSPLSAPPARRQVQDGSWHNVFMTPRAITIRLAEPRDAQAIAMMSRDFIESGLGWKYDAARVMRAIRDRETLAMVACDAKLATPAPAPAARAPINGFA